MRFAECHPDRPHYAHGQCSPCYLRDRRSTFPSTSTEGRRARYDPALNQSRKLAAYGMTVDDYDRLLADQGGGCAICGGEAGGRWGRFFVDHDHSTGAVRGLLCLRCNRAIGLLNDDPEVAERLARYLSYPQPPPQAAQWRKKR